MPEKTELQSSNDIHVVAHPHCTLCRSDGVVLYDNLTDRIFDAPGMWGLKRCLNPKCGLIWLDPMPVVEDIHIAYLNYHTHEDNSSPSSFPYRVYNAIRFGYLQKKFGYAKGVGPRWYKYLAPLAWFHPAGSDHAKASAMFLPAPRDSARLLDVGCGNGYLLKRMSEMGWQVAGTEVDAEALKVARSRGLTVYHGELSDQNFPDNSFDAVHLGNVIEHVYDPLALIQECRRILKPAGKLVILTPNSISWGHKHFKADWRGLEPPRHLQIFNPPSIKLVLEAAGFPAGQIKVITRVTEVLYISNMLKISKERYLGSPGNALVPKLIRMSWLLWERVLRLANSETGDEIVAVAEK